MLMSIDFIGLLDVTREGITLESLLAQVLEHRSVFTYFEEHFQRFRMQEWQVESLNPSPSQPSLLGVGGFIIDINFQTTCIWHGARFALFTGDSSHRMALRRVCLFFAELVGSQRAIYTHELMPYPEDECLAGIEAGLRTRIGPPAETFEELNNAEYFGPRAWYIDTFADIRLTT